MDKKQTARESEQQTGTYTEVVSQRADGTPFFHSSEDTERPVEDENAAAAYVAPALAKITGSIAAEDFGENNNSRKEIEEPVPTTAETSKNDEKIAPEIDAIREPSESEKKDKKKSKKKSFLPEDPKKRKLVILITSGVAAVGVIVGVLVWMFAIAPATTIEIRISKTAQKFSENLNFTEDKKASDPEKGLFLLSQLKTQDKSTIEFDATGNKNSGKKASGNVKLYVAFHNSGRATNVSLPAGTRFTTQGMGFTLNDAVNVSWDGIPNNPDCITSTPIGIHDTGLCLLSVDAKLTAEGNGTVYNISSLTANGWDSYTDPATGSVVSLMNKEAFTGGTDVYEKTITQGDVDTARVKLKADKSMKDDLIEAATSKQIPIPSTFTIKSEEPVSIPAVGEVVSRNRAILSMENTYTMRVADAEQLEEYITKVIEKDLAADQRIYEVSDISIKNFNETAVPFFAKVQAEVYTGPSITQEQVYNKVLGASNGQVRTLLASINGISRVDVIPNYPWVGSVPKDKAKVKINIKVEE